MNGTAQLTGMTLGLSISGAIFVNSATNGLYKALLSIPHDQVQQLIAGAAGNLLDTLNDEKRTQTLEVIVSSWQKTFTVVYVGAAVGLLCSVFLKVRYYPCTTNVLLKISSSLEHR